MRCPTSSTTLRHGAMRLSVFGALWLVLHGGGLGSVAVGAVVATAASWLSLVLLPPEREPLSIGALTRLALCFPAQSLRAGIDVARMAFAPARSLNPGLVPCTARLHAGRGRDAYHVYLSLQPGTLPVAMRDEATLLVHVLDVGQPVAAAVAVAEAAFAGTRVSGDD